VSLVVDGGSSFYMPHWNTPPKCINHKSLLEIAPYLSINNGEQTAKFYFHFSDYSQDPNFMISVLYHDIMAIFGDNPIQKEILYLQVLLYFFSKEK